MRFRGSSLVFVALGWCGAALAAGGCTGSGCPEGSEEVEGLCLAVDAGEREDPIESDGDAGDGSAAGSGGGSGMTGGGGEQGAAGRGGTAANAGAGGGAGAAGDTASMPDAGMDGGPDADVPECDAERPCSDDLECVDGVCTFIPPERVPSSVLQSSGGGAGRSESFKLRLAVGAPQPMGQGQSEQLRLRIGPAAAVQ